MPPPPTYLGHLHPCHIPGTSPGGDLGPHGCPSSPIMAGQARQGRCWLRGDALSRQPSLAPCVGDSQPSSIVRTFCLGMAPAAQGHWQIPVGWRGAGRDPKVGRTLAVSPCPRRVPALAPCTGRTGLLGCRTPAWPSGPRVTESLTKSPFPRRCRNSSGCWCLGTARPGYFQPTGTFPL